VVGESDRFHAIFGVSHGANNAGVFGTNDAGGAGVHGQSLADGVIGIGRRGVVGRSDTYQGVYGWSGDNAGVVGESDRFHAVFGVSRSANNAGIFGGNTAGGWAGIFDGRVSVEGQLFVKGDVVCRGADLAEEFDVERGAEVLPGHVVRLGGGGGLCAVSSAYDTSVIGIVSGAPGFRPALILDRRDGGHRLPVALVGKVTCFADAGPAPIRRGDLLTTSARPGHAMRVVDRGLAAGATVGKALGELHHGTGLIPVLVTLR
jgi:hypothetical protein